MDAVSKLLNELNTRMYVSSSSLNDYEIRKNMCLEIKNIFLKNNIVGSLTLEKTKNISKEDLLRIFELYNKDNFQEDYNKFNTFVRLIDSISGRTGTTEVPQLENAKKWINSKLYEINTFVLTFNKKGISQKEFLSKNYEYPKELLDMFRDGVLIKPILNFTKFYEYLDELDLSNLDKANIKIEIGKMHNDLFSNVLDGEAVDVISKYRNKLEAKMTRYGDVFNKISFLDADFLDRYKLIDKIMNDYSISFNEAKQGLVCLFLSKKIKEYDDADNKNDILEDLEDIIKFSSENITLEDIKTSDEVNSVIDDALNILDSEKELINSISEEEFINYINDSSSNNNDYMIVMVLMELLDEYKRFNETKNKDIKNVSLGNIRKYISSYRNLKKEE